jgi:hypothetical protein
LLVSRFQSCSRYTELVRGSSVDAPGCVAVSACFSRFSGKAGISSTVRRGCCGSSCEALSACFSHFSGKVGGHGIDSVICFIPILAKCIGVRIAEYYDCLLIIHSNDINLFVLPLLYLIIMPTCLETVQHNILSEANFLIHQKTLDICSLVPTQLNDFSSFFVIFNRTVARKVLFESLANAFHVQIVGQTRHRCDTLAAVSLLHAHVNLFFRRRATFVASVLEGVCEVIRNE